jgi:chemotaxis protein MotA
MGRFGPPLYPSFRLKRYRSLTGWTAPDMPGLQRPTASRLAWSQVMDIATALGLVLGIGTIAAIIVLSGGGIGMFVDYLSIVMVFGGTIAGVLVKFPLGTVLSGLPIGLKYAFKGTGATPRAMIDEVTQVAEVARKQGAAALENVEISEPFLKQGVRYIADGYEKDFIRATMETDRDNYLQRIDAGAKVWRAIGDAAPAWGMIGTILGMVMMFANMSDPSKLGPSMAVALLTTLYGAIIANFLALPIADKLVVKLEDEEVVRTLIIDGVLQVRDNKSPTLVREMLIAYLPDHHRAAFQDA